MPVSSLTVTDVGPFDEIALTFDPHVNIFTGPNNTGKSTLLWVLGELLVFPFGMPRKSLRSDGATWEIQVLSNDGEKSAKGTLPTLPGPLLEILEHIGYTCYIPAQRHSTDYRSPGPMSSREHESPFSDSFSFSEWYEERVASRITRSEGNRYPFSQREQGDDDYPPELAKRAKSMASGNSLVSDDAVKQKIIDLDYAAYRRRKPAIKSALNELASIASAVTHGFHLTFDGVAEDEDGLYPEFGTPDGPLPLDVLSQGTQSIVQFLARFLLGYAEYYDFPSDLREKPAVLIIDEIDAHLHPSWQQRVIPALTERFPHLQVFCSTHSPMMLAGLKTGQIQLLQRGETGNVSVTKNEMDIAGWTADEILRNIMGIVDPTDEASADRLRRLQELLEKEELSDDEASEVAQLRQEVRQDLLGGPTSTMVKEVADGLRGSLTTTSERC